MKRTIAETGVQAPVLRTTERAFQVLARLHGIIAGLFLALMFALLLVNIVLRYLFARGIPWAYEIHAVLLPWVVGCGMVLAAWEGRHIGLQFLTGRLRAGTRRAVRVLGHGVVLAVCLTVLWASPPVLRAAGLQHLATLGITQWWGYLALVWSFTAMAGIAAQRLLCLLLAGESAGPEGEAA